jgi:hypothetical protein
MPNFSFSNNALRELRKCLRSNAGDVIPVLQDLCSGYPEAKAFVERGFRTLGGQLKTGH